ncbi:MAG TPA: DUF3575 domain-containing protein [Chitinophagaceae bacterium]|nr:DUF3575 domain-containing protein [Chitinophagaceae bacterium]
MRNSIIAIMLLTFFLLGSVSVNAQQSDTAYSWKSAKKNIIRYNLSSALLFGFDKTIILGYERLLKPNRSFSINVGKAALPKLVDINFDSLEFKKDVKNTGFNISADYRFYLNSVNKYNAPRGVYIGPYYSFNQWNRKNDISFTTSNATEKLATSETDFNLHMVGFELGYQFVFWKRATLDMVLVGPGVGFYNVKAKAEGNLSEEEKQRFQDAVIRIIDEKFPGMNYVLSDKELDGNGTLKTSSFGFRYLIHIGFLF